MPRQTFLFDIGKVLLDFDFSIFRQRIAQNPAQNDALSQFLEKEQYGYESGQFHCDDFYVRAQKQLSFLSSADEFKSAWTAIFTPILPMWELAEKLAAEDHRLILFSNTNRLHADYFLAEYAIFSHFHGHHFSHEVLAMKPEAAFYQSAVEKYQLVPEETIYFDDRLENIEAGREFGFHSYQYDLKNHQAALKWLEALTPSLPSS